MADLSLYITFICDSIESYASVLERLATDTTLFESIDLVRDVRDAELGRFLDREFEGWTSNPNLPLKQIALALTREFPPTFSAPRKAAAILPDEEIEQLCITAEKKLHDGGFKLTLTIRSPEQLPLDRERVWSVLNDKYMPLALEIPAEPEEDLETTRALLEGREDVIWKKHRTFELSLPMRDMTRSFFLFVFSDNAEFLEQLDVPEDAFLLPIKIENERYGHLMALVFDEIARTTPGVGWTLIVHND